jgi:hypothetical protein
MVGTENHLLEGNYEDKTFAPGYGEFTSGVGANLEALALAVPTDAQPGGVPPGLEAISQGAAEDFAAADSGDWEAAMQSLDAMTAAWEAHRASGTVPSPLDVQMGQALDALRGNALMPAVDNRNREGARNAALDVEMAALDLELQYRPPAEVDLGRFAVWANQLAVDSTSDEADPGQVAGDVSSLEWIWDRIAHRVDQADVDAIGSQLEELRAAADDEDTDAAAEAAPQFVESAAPLAPRHRYRGTSGPSRKTASGATAACRSPARSPYRLSSRSPSRSSSFPLPSRSLFPYRTRPRPGPSSSGTRRR